MSLIIPIIFGIVQGLTEFIPVSSSGHLVILHAFFGPEAFADELAFDVALHVGTLASLLIFFRRECAQYLRAWFQSLPVVVRGLAVARAELSGEQRLAWYIVFAIIPAGLAGFFFEDLIDAWFRSPLTVMTMLVAVAIIFLWIERRGNEAFTRQLTEVRPSDAIFVGVMQILALIPGTSRSGITIVAGMMAGLTRAAAARFSFLVSIPLVAAAGLKKGIDLATMGIASAEIPSFIGGMLASATVGYVAIAFLLKFLERRSLRIFAWYRIGLAVVLCIVFLTL